jgi:hypothetical protein
MDMGITLFRRGSPADTHEDLGADDLRRLLEIERGQRLLLENAYEATVVALARTLESKDSETGALRAFIGLGTQINATSRSAT